MIRLILCGFILLGLISMDIPARASDFSDEILVTGSRMSYEDLLKEPHIVQKQRPDNVVQSISIICDTRDPELRLIELKTTMERLMAQAVTFPEIELGALIEREDDDGNETVFVTSYDHSRFGEYVSGGPRQDTSEVELVLKTRVIDAFRTENDAIEVFKKFIKSVQVRGRSEIIRSDDPVLSIINPGQYRYEIIADIAKDANQVSGAFGSEYVVHVRGLESPIIFYQTNELELTLYIPYAFDVVHQSRED